jgi:hypothetical protein
MNAPVLSLSAVAALALACSDVTRIGSDGGPDGDGGGTAAAYTGIWEVTGGSLFASSGQEVRFLELDADGTGQLYARQEASGVLACGLTAIHAQLGSNVISIDLLGLRSYRFEMPDDDTLILSDANEVTLEMTRTSAVPDGDRCVVVEGDLVELEEGVVPDYWSGLAVKDDTTLWFAGQDGEIQQVNPADGTAGPPLAHDGYRYIQTAVDGDFWAHCACGDIRDMHLYTPGNPTPIEMIDTAELEQIGVYGVAWDGTTLWVGGYKYDSGTGGFLHIGGSPGARTVLGSFDFNPAPKSIAARGEELWALVSNYSSALVQIDLETEKAMATYQLPIGVYWTGLTSDGTGLYLSGQRNDGTGVLFHLTP